MAQTGIVILCHGSRGEQGSVEVAETLKRLSEGVKSLLAPALRLSGRHFSLIAPLLRKRWRLWQGGGWSG